MSSVCIQLKDTPFVSLTEAQKLIQWNQGYAAHATLLYIYIYSYSSTAQSICSTLQRWITCALTSFNCSINIQYRFSTATTYFPSRCGSVNLPWRLTFLCFPVSVGCTTTTLWLNYSIENYEFGIMHNVASASSKPIYDCPFYYVNSFINPKAVTDETAC